ncbi:chaperone modulator CbpM [Aurantivibrio infirmus]
MNSTLLIQITTLELCEQINETTDTVIEIVEHGILDVQGEVPDEWLFDESAVEIAQRAIRMRRDLEINWAGIALTLDLLEEKQRIQAENLRLKQRLSRFIIDD